MTSRTFKPVILFHDYSYYSNSDPTTPQRSYIPYGDPYYTPLIQKKKQKVNFMLESNGQAWHDIRRKSLQQQQYSPLLSPRPSSPPTLYKSVSTAIKQQQQKHHHSHSHHHSSKRHTNNTTTTSQRLLLQHYGGNSQHSNITVSKKKRHYYASDKPVVGGHHSSHRHHHHHHHVESDQDSNSEDEQNSQEEDSSITSESISSCSSHSTSAIGSPIPTNNIIARKRRGNLPKSVTAVLKQWLIDHCRNPYPTEAEKTGLKDKTGLTLNQISNWFINARRRLLPQILDSMQLTTIQQHMDSRISAAGTHTANEEQTSVTTIKKRKRASTKMEFDDFDHQQEDDLMNNTPEQILLKPNTGTTTIVRKRRRYNKRSVNVA